jgi:plastocyanin
MRIIRRAPLAVTAAVLLAGTVAVPAAGAAPAAKPKPVVKKVKVAAATLTAAKSKAVVKKVKVADDFYSPTKLTIKVGDKVNFVWSQTNNDTHNVTLVSGPKGVSKKQFTSLDASTSFHFERTFTVPGKYHFLCTIHPTMMNTFITVKK